MRRRLAIVRRRAFMAVGVCAVAVCAVGCGSSMDALSETEAAMRAALESGAAQEVEPLLDPEFQWTDARGVTRPVAESVGRLSELGAALADESNARRYDYGSLVVVTTAGASERRMRVWVRRAEGWRVFAVIETTVASGAPPFAMPTGTVADCENPCRSMPFVPANNNQRLIAEIFMRLKMDEWHPDAADWAPYVLDDVYYVTSAARLSKADRLERLKKAEALNAPSVPGDPVVEMRIFDFDEAAVMVARHHPFLGGQPYHSVRVWALRDGRWQLANTQQTVMVNEPAAPPVTSTQ